MPEFYADTRDLKFVLFEQAQLDKILALPAFKDFDRDTIEAVVDEAFKFAKNQMAPMNVESDRVGATYDKKTSQVKVPPMFHETYKQFCENGWLAMSNTPDFGGQGMPYAVHLACNDYFFGACLSFCLNALLTTGAAHLVESFGSDELKKIYLQNMYTGTWAGTMCLTESGAGSDVGALKTRARKEGDHYLIEGEKIFISAGDQDLTDNICHAVLARIEGAPAGTKGISLFLVPKVRVKPDGSLGEPNDVRCTGIEHKMGIHGSPTCTLVFGENGGCHGYLLGEENKGMRAMFQMMNEARISVGLQGAALANAAYQFALNYAKERVQGKHILQMKDDDAPATAIINHPDIRQMLMWQKAWSEGCRALLIRTAAFEDMAAHTQDAAEKDKYQGLVEILTPVCKAYCSDIGFRCTELSLQTLGGYGYIGEYPVEQYLRDNKIASIYEGTNGIQALDLMGRKLPAKGGMNLMTLATFMNELIDANAKHEVLAEDFKLLAEARDALADASMYFASKGAKDPLVPVLNATPYLDLFGQVVLGWLLLEQAALCYPKLKALCADKKVDMADAKALATLCEDNGDAKFYDGKIKVAKFYAARGLSLCRPKAEVLKRGDKTPLAITF
ncbi:MAG: acyl-CoA dehydrogenase [Pseudomonadota bacterium]